MSFSNALIGRNASYKCPFEVAVNFLFCKKAHLEAEGHTAVQPSEFFLGEDSSSALLIILRNEDIVEHMCEVIVQLISKCKAEDSL